MARLGAARIVAAHVQQLSPGNVAIRNEHVEWVRSVCDGRDYVLAVGDFNSTAGASAGAPTTGPSWSRCRPPRRPDDRTGSHLPVRCRQRLAP